MPAAGRDGRHQRRYRQRSPDCQARSAARIGGAETGGGERCPAAAIVIFAGFIERRVRHRARGRRPRSPGPRAPVVPRAAAPVSSIRLLPSTSTTGPAEDSPPPPPPPQAARPGRRQANIRAREKNSRPEVAGESWSGGRRNMVGGQKLFETGHRVTFKVVKVKLGLIALKSATNSHRPFRPTICIEPYRINIFKHCFNVYFSGFHLKINRK